MRICMALKGCGTMKLPGGRTLAATIAAVALVAGFCPPQRGYAGQPDTAAVSAAAQNTVHLYFADRRGRFLHARERVFKHPSDPLALGRAILGMLIEGPRSGPGRTLPAGSQVRAFFIDGDTAVVDFNEAVREKHPGGCRTELLTIFSVVNSLVLNMDGVEQVRILIEGREVDTLAGHIDLHPAYAADMLLVR